MRTRCILIIGVAIVLIGPGAALAQPGRSPGGFGGGGFGGQGGGGSSFFSDPKAMFDRMARDRNYFLISETKMMREPLMEYAKKNGITDDKITREQFMAAWPLIQTALADGMKSRFSGGFSSGKSFSFGSTGAGGSSGSTPGGAAPTSAADFKTLLEAEFKRRDENADGKLNTDEMSRSLRDDLAKWDTNKDGLIDLAEFTPYFQARLDRDSDRSAAAAVNVIIEDDLDRRPVVYRAGKLPKELPPWFQELDVDTDGQVSFYEWRKQQKDVAEFKQYDRNDDGFLICEEVLRQMNLAKTTPMQTATTQTTTTSTAAAPSGSSGRPGFGGFGQGGFGQGGFGSRPGGGTGGGFPSGGSGGPGGGFRGKRGNE